MSKAKNAVTSAVSNVGNKVGNTVQNVGNRIGNAASNLSSTNTGYQAAADRYSALMQEYRNSLNQNTGEGGYEKSLGLAAKGANLQAGAAQQQAQNAYRSAGLSKAQAANMAAGQANQAYQNNFTGQQGVAANQLGNKVTGSGNMVSQQGQLMQAQQQEGQNAYNRAWGNVGNTMGIAGSFINALSDERLKDSLKISSTGTKPQTARDYSMKLQELFDKKMAKSENIVSLCARGLQ